MLTGKAQARHPIRRDAPAHNALPPIGEHEMAARRANGRDGSERLHAMIEAIVTRMADSLAVPDGWQHRRKDFARAYLGMEVAE
ncbi:MAG: hypothetical protein ABIV36_22595 [Sphingobium limneticum]